MAENEMDPIKVLLRTEQARIAYGELRLRAMKILNEVRNDIRDLDLRDEEKVDVMTSLAGLEWNMERDAIDTATNIEREEQKLRAEVAAAGLLLSHEMRED
jgi:hypothetical protein